LATGAPGFSTSLAGGTSQFSRANHGTEYFLSSNAADEEPAVTSLVVGARTEGQLADNLAAATLSLTDAEREQLDKASAPPLIYPYWHQAKTARDRLSPADMTLLGPHLR